MVRTRIPEASLVGLLAALATFCALEARGGQPYSIVGQSSPATAATGRRPLAERIKAANRPIRITAEEELAPDQGLIPALDDPNTVEREWLPGPAVVEFPTGGPEAIAIDETVPTEEPGVMPPPDSTAIAAHPTTADDAGLVGEASTIETDPSVTSPEADGSTERPAAATTGKAADRLPEGSTARAQSARVTPPRRTTVRVTPQRREALLDRLRSALAEVPRPLGLIPAPSRQPANARRPQSAPRSAVARHPVPAASLPTPLAALPATTPSEADVAGALPLETAPTDELPAAEPSLDEAGAIAENSAATETFDAPHDPAVADVEAGPTIAETTNDPVAADASDACPATAECESEVVSTEEPAADPVATLAHSAEATPVAAIPATDLPATPSTDLTANPNLRQPRATSQPQRQGSSQRSRASNNCQPPMTPLDRLQARLEQMPRALGLVPAPRPSMHANQSTRRRATPPASASEGTVATAPSPKAERTTEPTPADQDLVARDEGGEIPGLAVTIDADVALDAPETERETGEEGSSGPSVPEVTEPALATDAEVGQGELAAVEEVGAVSTLPPSDTVTVEEAADPVTRSKSVDAPAEVATILDQSPMPVPVAEASAAAVTPRGTVAKDRPATRHHTHQRSEPIVRRPVRDALESALANMPRPFGLLPEPEPAPHRRPAAATANRTAAPRALATKSIGTRPLDSDSKSQADISRAIVTAPPAAPQADDDATTLTSGNDAAEETTVATTDSGTEPAPLAVDAAEGTTNSGVSQTSSASVEVTVEGPEESTTLGERVTFHLTIRNGTSTPVSSVIPVVHFGKGLEPLGIRGRNGHFSADGSVTFERLAELPPGESVELEIVAVCTGVGEIPCRGVACCGEGDDVEVVPADASVTVTPTAIATEPDAVRRR